MLNYSPALVQLLQLVDVWHYKINWQICYKPLWNLWKETLKISDEESGSQVRTMTNIRASFVCLSFSQWDREHQEITDESYKEMSET